MKHRIAWAALILIGLGAGLSAAVPSARYAGFSRGEGLKAHFLVNGFPKHEFGQEGEKVSSFLNPFFAAKDNVAGFVFDPAEATAASKLAFSLARIGADRERVFLAECWIEFEGGAENRIVKISHFSKEGGLEADAVSMVELGLKEHVQVRVDFASGKVLAQKKLPEGPSRVEFFIAEGPDGAPELPWPREAVGKGLDAKGSQELLRAVDGYFKAIAQKNVEGMLSYQTAKLKLWANAQGVALDKFLEGEREYYGGLMKAGFAFTHPPLSQLRFKETPYSGVVKVESTTPIEMKGGGQTLRLELLFARHKGEWVLVF